MYFVSISRRFGPAVLYTKEQIKQRDLYTKILEFEQETVRACRSLIIKRKGATIEFRAVQGKHIQIGQNLLLNETDNESSFCYSMIWK